MTPPSLTRLLAILYFCLLAFIKLSPSKPIEGETWGRRSRTQFLQRLRSFEGEEYSHVSQEKESRSDV